MLGEVDVPTMRLGCQSKLFSAGPSERLFLKGVEGLSDYLCPVEIFLGPVCRWSRGSGLPSECPGSLLSRRSSVVVCPCVKLKIRVREKYK